VKTFLGGEPIPDGYLEEVQELITTACDAEDKFDEWELEQFSENWRNERQKKQTEQEFREEYFCKPHTD
jgi:hypothetical protein